MINNEQFTKRIKKIMEHHQFTASSFADKIGVQRSSISHILSGRNKPSLDFILKVSNAIPDVAIEWLLKGKGSYPTSNTSNQQAVDTLSAPSLFDANNTSNGKRINRIVVFYNDGTFDEYHKQ
ncbi:MAG: transcriptional regulator [Flavobacteriaceae bacterium]|nr:transcriptional regulator [Flavobacteriaceae bacterium]|tara:strand:- start:265857 stop:266225 length:369 start_codon:yes stop_codon:yes gene_type:complete